VAVLDWELSTLGDPLSDFANNAMAWRIEPELFRGLAGADLATLGIPTEAAYAASYMARSGRSAAGAWDFYIVFNLFRLAAIFQGIAKRVLDGTASDPNAAVTGAKATAMAEKGWALAQTIQG
jgi:aminoglycoside phosphotransferase (APT) family kinase protein